MDSTSMSSGNSGGGVGGFPVLLLILVTLAGLIPILCFAIKFIKYRKAVATNNLNASKPNKSFGIIAVVSLFVSIMIFSFALISKLPTDITGKWNFDEGQIVFSDDNNFYIVGSDDSVYGKYKITQTLITLEAEGKSITCHYEISDNILIIDSGNEEIILVSDD